MSESPYAVLGLHSDATTKQIFNAYRSRSKATHPDMKGGSAEKFHAVAQAYEAIGYEDARDHYDRTGEWDNGESIDAEALKVVARHMINITTGTNPKNIDLIFEITDSIRQEIKDSIKADSIRMRLSDRLRIVAPNITSRNGTENLLSDMAKNLHADMEGPEKKSVENKLAICRAAVDILQRHRMVFSE